MNDELKVKMEECRKNLEALVESEAIIKIGEKTTSVTLICHDGFEITATASCVNPAEYNVDIGAPIARERAYCKLGELDGYFRQRAASIKPEPAPAS